MAKKFAIAPDKIIANKGFKISSSNFNFMSIVFVITFKSSKHAKIKLTNQPKINATIPLYGIQKYMKKHNNEHSVFKRFVRFLKKNRGSYVSVCLVVVLIILIGKAVDSSINNGGFDLKTSLAVKVDFVVFV